MPFATTPCTSFVTVILVLVLVLVLVVPFFVIVPIIVIVTSFIPNPVHWVYVFRVQSKGVGYSDGYAIHAVLHIKYVYCVTHYFPLLVLNHHFGSVPELLVATFLQSLNQLAYRHVVYLLLLQLYHFLAWM